ncbi:MAG: 4-alpha-glucanotransferase [Nitrospirales bacterium]
MTPVSTPTRSDSELLRLLASSYGIALDYFDNWGTRHSASDQTLHALLRAMGVRAGSRRALEEEVLACERGPWALVCDPVLVWRRDRDGGTWSVRLPAEAGEEAAVRMLWEVRNEAGAFQCEQQAGPDLTPVETVILEGRRFVRFELPIPSGLGIGYYTVKVQARTPTTRVMGRLRLILVPPRCFVPKALTEGRKTWGVALQLYSLRSKRNWGVGDLGDLADLARRSGASLGIGLLGLNPLHNLKNSHPFHTSPYSPDSRMCLNPLYVDIEHVPEWQDSPQAQALLETPAFRSRLQAARESDLVEYDLVWALKRQVLEHLFATFQSRHDRPESERGRAFRRFIEQGGETLERFATFQALTEKFRQELPEVWNWRDWPAEYRHPSSPAVAVFRQAQAAQVRFHQYLQWVVTEQLAAAQASAEASGLCIGLYMDQALGSHGAGSDAWVFQDILALGADCGAPPDAFSPQGQNWGFPPVNPVRLRASGYRMFTELLRRNLRQAGAFRLDHVMALVRLFWIPQGANPAAGTYVGYPAEDLLGILALESVRHRALVVGEDLGTVPDEVRQMLLHYGLLSYRVFYFEREGNQGATWRPPGAYPEQAVAVATTHDLPTLVGFWGGRDIEVRSRLGIFPNEDSRRQAKAERHQAKRQILEALQAEGLLPPGMSVDPTSVPVLTPELNLGIQTYLARTPCWIVLVALEDILGMRDQVNLPGTVDAHPNWSQKVPVLLEDLFQGNWLRQLADMFRAVRPPA